MNFIETSYSNGIYTLTLSREDKYNSFTEEMSIEVQEALDESSKDSSVRCILITGKGKAFCAGQDLAEVVERSKNPEYVLGHTVEKSYNPVVRKIRSLEKPVVCAVNGIAAGAGANIAIACDIVLADEHAVFVESFSKIGLIPDSAGTFFLPRIIGTARANAMYFLDEKLTAAKAVEWGLIYASCESGTLMEEAMQVCAKLASLPTKGFGLYKRAVNAGFSNSLDEQLELERELQTEAGKSHDYNEGVAAFLEKRRPVFTGK